MNLHKSRPSDVGENMSSSQRQIIGAIFGILGSLLLCIAIFAGLLLAALWYFGGTMCGNQIIQEIPSPDNRFRVVVYERNCGATTDFSTHISILEKSETLNENSGGNIMTMDGHPDWSIEEITWQRNRNVLILYNPEYEVHQKRSSFSYYFSVITIDYQPIIE